MTLRFESKGLPSSRTLSLLRVPWPPFDAPWSRVLQGYQRNREQCAADVADRVRRLHQSTTGPARVRSPRSQRLDIVGQHVRHVELVNHKNVSVPSSGSEALQLLKCSPLPC